MLARIGGLLAIVALLASCKKEEAGNRHDPSQPIVIDDFVPKEGSAGTQILIDGSNFSSDLSAIRVSVNGIPLHVIGSNGRQIMAVVPKKLGAGTINVAVGTASGASAAPFTYRYTRTVTTLAGNGTAGFANGQGADAQFNFSGEAWYRGMGIAVDDDLNVYVADPGNHCIRRIDSLGNVTTFAGNPAAGGYADGQGTQARFSLPYDVALDAAGNVYCVDPGNWDIRKITPNGTATTLAFGAQSPWSVAVDGNGSVYYGCAESPGNIYRLSAENTSEPIVTGLNGPSGIAFDAADNLYVAISGDHTIRRFAAGSWASSVIAGQAGTAGYVNGAATDARFSFPWGLALDRQGDIYIAGNGTWDGGDYNADQSVRYVQLGSGQVSTFAGSQAYGYTNAIGESASFRAPLGVCVDKNGAVYVLDKGNNVIRKIVSE